MTNVIDNITSSLAALNRRALPTLANLDRFIDWCAGYDTSDTWAGEGVTTSTSLKISAIWSAVQLISGGIAKTPRRVLRVEGSSRFEDRAHYLHDLLNYRANPYMSSYRFFRLMETWLLLNGNAIAWLEIDGRNRISAMWPWMPTQVDTLEQGGSLHYRYTMADGKQIIKPDWEILHVRGLETDGFWGLSPITVHRETVAQAQAMQRHASTFYKNSARPLGVLTFPSNMSPESRKEVREAWEKVHGGSGNAHKIGILHEGVNYTDVRMMSMADAQYIETANLSLGDFARIFNLPPHKIGDLSRSTNNNIEHQAMEHHEDCLDPRYVNWESELTISLMSDSERRTHILSFDRNALKRMDSKGRAAYIGAMRQWAGMHINEARVLEDLNPDPHPNSNKPYVPVNMMPIDAPLTVAQPAPDSPEPKSDIEE